LLPGAVGLQRIFLARGAGHLDERSGPADKRGGAGRSVILLGKGAHERKVNMHVRIDEAGKDQLSRGIDHFGPRRNGEASSDGANSFVLDEDVAFQASLRGYNLTALDQQSHRYALPSCLR